MTDKKRIAETTLYAVDKESRAFEIRAMVGAPYKDESGDWACPVSLDGLHGQLQDIYGVDSWQSLVLAMNLVGNLLTYFVEDGGKLYREKGGDEISVADLFADVEEAPESEWPP